MIDAFWYLMRRSLRNRLIRQMDRLREPRYAISLLVGVAYIWFFLFSQRRPTSVNPGTVFATLVPLLGSLFLFIAVARWWLFGGNQAALTFTPAEIQFLFPAPLSRAALIRWKLLRSQLRILLNTIVWIVITRRTRPPLPMPLYLLALWSMFSTLSMHRLGATLVRAGLGRHWRTGFKRQAIPLMLVAGAAVGLLVTILPHWAELQARCCDQSFVVLLGQVFNEPVARAVLYPFHLMLAAVAAPTTSAWLAAFPPLLGLLAIHFVWVTRSQAAFEEAALQASADAARRSARLRGEKPAHSPRAAGRTLVRLPPLGWRGTAVIWKNLIAISRGSVTKGGLIAIGVLVAVMASMGSEQHQSSLAVLVGTAALVMTAMLAFLGPTWIRNDLRQDMPFLSVLRTFPLRGRTIVAAEIAGSALTLSILQVGLLIIAALGFRGSPEAARLPFSGWFLLLAPIGLLLLNTIGMAVQNAGALLFPAWIRFDQVRAGGFETMGQNIVSSLFTLFLTVISVGIPLGAGWFTWWVSGGSTSVIAIVSAVAVAVMVIVAEVITLLRWLGDVFERTESLT
jgi:hypothetical protein